MADFTVFRPIRRGDIQTTVRTAYPEFTASNTTYSSSGFGAYAAVYSPTIPEIGTSTTYLTNSYDGSIQSLLWSSIDQLYYAHPYELDKTHEHFNKNRTYKFLYRSASVITIPQQYYGNKIKPGSLRITGSFYENSPGDIGVTFDLYDDGYGNLCDPRINTASFATSSKLLFNISFNNEFRNCTAIPGLNIKNELPYKSNVFAVETPAKINNITYYSGVPYNQNLDAALAIILYPSGSHDAGISAYFQSGSSYIHIPYNDNLSFGTQQPYSISFWMKCFSGSFLPGNTENYIFSKRGTESQMIFDSDLNQTVLRTRNILRSRYPVSLYVSSSGKLVYEMSDGTNVNRLVSSASVADNSYHHIIVTYDVTNNRQSIFVDTVFDSTLTSSYHYPMTNKSDIVIGAMNLSGSNQYVGYLSEINAYTYSLYLQSSSVDSLYHNSILTSSIYQTNVVGNVFYKSGVVVISTPMPMFSNLYAPFSVDQTQNNDWTLTYKGEQNIIENEVLVRIPANVFNSTLNPTILEPNSDLIKNELRTGSLSPYISTIGLYDDEGSLLVVGKLGRVIQKRDDVDFNFILKWDT